MRASHPSNINFGHKRNQNEGNCKCLKLGYKHKIVKPELTYLFQRRIEYFEIKKNH